MQTNRNKVLWIIIIALGLIVLAKTFMVALSGAALMALAWFFVGLWVLSIPVAFYKNMDMPVGGFGGYCEGANQAVRIFCLFVWIIAFIVAAYFD